MSAEIEYFKVTEYGFPPEFARRVPTPNGTSTQAYRNGEWVAAFDLANVFHGGEGKVEALDSDPTA